MIKIYFVRHGQTENNIRKKLAGIVNVSLNENGIKQAELIAEELKDERFDFVFCSPLKRAIDTANIINKYHGKNIEINESLIERNFGELAGHSHVSVDRKILWNYYKDKCLYPDIESVKEVFERVNLFIEHLLKNYDGKSVLIVAHSGVFRPFYYYKNSIPADGNLLEVRPNNASVTIFEF